MTLTRALLKLNRAELQGYGQRTLVLRMMRPDGSEVAYTIGDIQVIANAGSSEVCVKAQVSDVAA